MAAWFWMKGLGWKVASFGTVLFGLAYLRGGPMQSMEREYLILLPISIALLVASSFPRLNYLLKGFIIGMLFGLSVLIKPYALVGYPIVMLSQLLDRERNKTVWYLSSRSLLVLSSSLIGLALPIIAVVIYLWRVDALRNFWSIVTNYYPLFAEISGDHERLVGLARIKYLYNGYFTFGSYTLWFMPAVLGVYVSLFHSTLTIAQKRQVLLLVGLAFVYSIYALLGQSHLISKSAGL